MTSYNVPFVGERDFKPTPDNYWRFAISLPAGELDVIVELHGGSLADGLRKAGALFTSLEALDETACRAIREEYNDSPSTSAYFVRYFMEHYDTDELPDLFGTESDDIGVDELLRALQLKAVRFNLGQTAQFLYAEFRLDVDASMQRLVVYFDSNGAVEMVTMES